MHLRKDGGGTSLTVSQKTVTVYGRKIGKTIMINILKKIQSKKNKKFYLILIKIII